MESIGPNETAHWKVDLAKDLGLGGNASTRFCALTMCNNTITAKVTECAIYRAPCYAGLYIAGGHRIATSWLNNQSPSKRDDKPAKTSELVDRQFCGSKIDLGITVVVTDHLQRNLATSSLSDWSSGLSRRHDTSLRSTHICIKNDSLPPKWRAEDVD